MNLIFKDIFLKLAPLFFGHAKEKRGPYLRRDDGNKAR